MLGYTDPESGQDYYLRVKQALHAPHLEASLLCPMQMRMSGISVDERPKFLTDQPSEKNHAIVIPRGNGNNDDDNLVIPLSCRGVISYFDTFKPTLEAYERDAVEGVNTFTLTCESPEWDPHSSTFEQQEDAALNTVDITPDYLQQRPRSIFGLRSDELRFDDLFNSLEANRNINEIRSDILSTVDRGQEADLTFQVFSLESGEDLSILALSPVAKPAIDPKVLAKQWGIRLEAARKTLEKKPQRIIRIRSYAFKTLPNQ